MIDNDFVTDVLRSYPAKTSVNMTLRLLLDCHLLIHRAYHGMPDLSHDDIPTAVPFGFLREVISLVEAFSTPNVVFCFDLGRSKRCDIYPAYKANRKHKTPEEQEKRVALGDQIYYLRESLLPRVGFSNVFAYEGYEADDLIAALCVDRPRKDEYVIVSSDKDLWQLLEGDGGGPGVVMYNPHKKETMTAAKFTEQWGLDPTDWPAVKAVAGCTTDNIAGVAGVGEKTAAKYWRQELPMMNKRRINIIESNGMWTQNLQLVILPFAGTPLPVLLPDAFNVAQWQQVCDELGMKSIRNWRPLGLSPSIRE